MVRFHLHVRERHREPDDRKLGCSGGGLNGDIRFSFMDSLITVHLQHALPLVRQDHTKDVIAPTFKVQIQSLYQ